MEHQYTHLSFTLVSLFLFLPVFRQWTGWDPEAVKSPGTLHQPTPGLRVPDNATWRHVSGVWSCGEAFHTNHLPVQWKHRCLQGMCTVIPIILQPRLLRPPLLYGGMGLGHFEKFKDLCWWGLGVFLASSIKTRKENLNFFCNYRCSVDIGSCMVTLPPTSILSLPCLLMGNIGDAQTLICK